MKKIILILVAIMLAAFPAAVFAGNGAADNPNQVELNMDCEGEGEVHVTIPSVFGNASGRTDDGRTAHPRTHKIDYEKDGVWDVEYVLSQGQGFETTFCTWTWDYDSYLHGMDIQFSPDK